MLPPAGTRSSRLKCQPVSGSKRSTWISTVPPDAFATSGRSVTGLPGATVGAASRSVVAVISRISSDSVYRDAGIAEARGHRHDVAARLEASPQRRMRAETLSVVAQQLEAKAVRDVQPDVAAPLHVEVVEVADVQAGRIERSLRARRGCGARSRHRDRRAPQARTGAGSACVLASPLATTSSTYAPAPSGPGVNVV